MSHFHNSEISSVLSIYVELSFGRIFISFYSDARVLTIFELMRVMTLPDDWNIPDWATPQLIRQVIGEGIPPLLIKKLVAQLNLSTEANE